MAGVLTLLGIMTVKAHLGSDSLVFLGLIGVLTYTGIAAVFSMALHNCSFVKRDRPELTRSFIQGLVDSAGILYGAILARGYPVFHTILFFIVFVMLTTSYTFLFENIQRVQTSEAASTNRESKMLQVGLFLSMVAVLIAGFFPTLGSLSPWPFVLPSLILLFFSLYKIRVSPSPKESYARALVLMKVTMVIQFIQFLGI